MKNMQNRRLIVCNAIDTNRYRHTLAPRNEAKDNYDRLIRDFAHYFPSQATQVKTRDSLLRLVSISPEAREWYASWSKSEANATSFPDWLDKTKESDLKYFDSLSISREELSKKEKEWNGRVVKASETMKSVIKSVDSEKKDYYSRLDNLLKINLVTPAQLPLSDQAEIASVPSDAERRVLTKTKILAFQRVLKTQLDKGDFKDPFA